MQACKSEAYDRPCKIQRETTARNHNRPGKTDTARGAFRKIQVRRQTPRPLPGHIPAKGSGKSISTTERRTSDPGLFPPQRKNSEKSERRHRPDTDAIRMRKFRSEAPTLPTKTVRSARAAVSSEIPDHPPHDEQRAVGIHRRTMLHDGTPPDGGPASAEGRPRHRRGIRQGNRFRFVPETPGATPCMNTLSVSVGDGEPLLRYLRQQMLRAGQKLTF